MAYIAVYEDEFGVRTWTSYETEKPNISNKKYLVVEGITSEEAVEFCNQTPEICRIMHSLEGAFTKNFGCNSSRLNYQLQMAQYAIDQERRKLAGQGEKILPDASKYLVKFRAQYTTTSLKDEIARDFLDIVQNEHGQVKYSLLPSTIRGAVTKANTQKIFNAHKSD
jgi:hypothetical protein